MIAEWIAPEKSNSHQWWNFKKEFVVDKTDGEYLMNITSYGYYKVYINGCFVNAGPCRSFDYKKSYDRIDVTEYIKNGKNQIAVIAMHLEHMGILLELQLDNKKIVATDNTWKVMRNMCFSEKTFGDCAPLEPIRAEEEHYDNRKSEPWMEMDYDFSSWDNAVAISDGEFENLNEGGLLTNDIALPESVIAVCEYDNNSGYYFRLRSDSTITDPITKGCLNIYMTVLTVDEAVEINVHKMYVNKLYIDGKMVGDSVSLEKGRHFVICVGMSPEQELLFETDKKVEFSANEINSGICSKWCVLNLSAARKYFAAWAGGSELNAEASIILNEITKCAIWSELSSEAREAVKCVEDLAPSIGFMMRQKKYFLPQGGFIKPELKFNPSETEAACLVSDTHSLLHTNQVYTRISKGSHNGVCIVVDFGIVRMGYITFSLYAEAGTTIDFANFELIDPNGIHHNDKACMRYTCSEGYQTYTAHLPRGQRYMAMYISNFKKDVRLKYVGINEAICSVDSIGSFECDDYKLNRVFKMCTDSVLKCMADTYMDCPGYEQVYWVGDSKVTSEVNMLCFGRYDYDYNCLKLIGESMSEQYKAVYRKGNQMYEDNKYLTLPAYGTYVDGGLPTWSFMWVLQIYDNYLHSGNKEYLLSLYPQMKKMLENCEHMMSDRYLFSMDGAWNLIEWANNDLLCCGEVTASTALLAKCSYIAAELAEACDDGGMVDIYIKRAEKMKEAINKYCWSDKLQGYVDCPRDEESYRIYKDFFENHYMTPVAFDEYTKRERISQQTNTIVYICDCAISDRAERCENIISLAESGEYEPSSPAAPRTNAEIVKIGSPFFLYFTFKALEKMGETRIMQKIMIRDYGKLLDYGTNTCWEEFPRSETHWTRSICHAWGASPAIYLLKAVCGINAVEPGFEKFTFTPDLGDLTWVKASVATPYGPIYVHIDKNKNICNIDYPKECELIQEESIS